MNAETVTAQIALLRQTLGEAMRKAGLDYSEAALHPDTAGMFRELADLSAKLLLAKDPSLDPKRRARGYMGAFRAQAREIIAKAQADINAIIAASPELQKLGVRAALRVSTHGVSLRGSSDQYYWQHVQADDDRICRTVASGGVPSLEALIEVYPQDESALAALMRGQAETLADRRRQIASEIGVDRSVFIFRDGTRLFLRRRRT
jgi:hypothetical protein